jgi:8-hydroxy-5-deazaflavin:NADPH oxidoreductase
VLGAGGNLRNLAGQGKGVESRSSRKLRTLLPVSETEEAQVKVTIIGAGNMGRAIGTRAVAAGHELELIDRNPEDATRLADELSGDGSAIAIEPGGRIGGEIVVFALYYPGLLDGVGQYRDQLEDRVVVETSNPVDFESFEGLATPPDSSASEEVAKLVPQGTPVVKAFNTTFAKTLISGQVAGQQLDVLIAGDDASAKQKVAQLVESAGLRPIDVGPLRRARQLEQVGFLLIALQEPLGWGFASAVKFLAP